MLPKKKSRIRKNKRGGNNKCGPTKPICIKKKNKQYIQCTGNEDGDLNSELNHAYEVFSSNEPDNAPEPDNSEGFCTNFDFVWLTNMAEAKRSLIKFKELYNKQSINIDDIDISDIKKNVASIKKFDLNQFIQSYIDIAKKKWNIENNDDELFDILELIKITQKNLDDYMEKNKEIYDEIFNQTETILNNMNEGEIKKLLENKDKPSINPQLKMVFDLIDIGKYVLYERNQFNNVDLDNIRDILNNINDMAQHKGGKRKTRNKKKYKGKTKKHIKLKGGWFGKLLCTGTLLTIPFLIASACTAVLSFGGSLAAFIVLAVACGFSKLLTKR